MTTNIPDNKIIEDVLSGNSEAFASLMKRYAPKVFAMTASMIGNNEDAADITQEIFTKVFTSLSSFKRQSSFSTWLFKISYNMTASRLRKISRVETSACDDDFWNNIADTIQDNDDIDDYAVSVDQLFDALNRLSPNERTLISLFYLDNKSITEIAFIMSLSETNAKTRLFRIRKKLQKIISHEF